MPAASQAHTSARIYAKMKLISPPTRNTNLREFLAAPVPGVATPKKIIINIPTAGSIVWVSVDIYVWIH